MGAPASGVVPQVAIGRMAAPSSTTSLSNRAPGSVARARQRSTASSQAAPSGTCRRPFSHAKVVSSGAIMPARAPASMDMLHRVMRPSMSSARTASPAYSMTWPVPPPKPMAAITASATSLPDTLGCSRPSTVTRRVRARRCSRHWVASTWPTSDVPMPKAKAPKAPCVAVWLSPHTTVMPGWVRPSSGPMTCTTPRSSESQPASGTPCAAQFRSSACTCASASRVT